MQWAFMTANYVGRALGYANNTDWMANHRATVEAFHGPQFGARFAEMIDDITGAGFDAIELWVAHLDPLLATPEMIATANQILRERGVKLISLYRRLRPARRPGVGAVQGPCGHLLRHHDGPGPDVLGAGVTGMRHRPSRHGSDMGKPCAVSGAMIMCTFGLAPSTLTVVAPRPIVEGRPVATITDIAPGANIAPFGMCQSLANPTVAAATAAALGVLTPMPCVPVMPAPWIPMAPQTMAGGVPVLVAGSTCVCALRRFDLAGHARRCPHDGRPDMGDHTKPNNASGLDSDRTSSTRPEPSSAQRQEWECRPTPHPVCTSKKWPQRKRCCPRHRPRWRHSSASPSAPRRTTPPTRRASHPGWSPAGRSSRTCTAASPRCDASALGVRLLRQRRRAGLHRPGSQHRAVR